MHRKMSNVLASDVNSDLAVPTQSPTRTRPTPSQKARRSELKARFTRF